MPSPLSSAETRTTKFAERDVRVPRAVFGVEELHQNRVLRQRGHRQRRDELLGQRGHHHTHLGACRFEQPAERGSLVGRDAPRDAQQDAPSLQRSVRYLPGLHGRSGVTPPLRPKDFQ